MSKNNRNWTQSWQYQRALEILQNYWLNCPDEAFVMVSMYFRKLNGEEQLKEITWHNPNVRRKKEIGSDSIIQLSDIDFSHQRSFYDTARERADEFLTSLE